MSVAQLQQRLEALLSFMQPYWKFVNCHMVNYFTEDHWQHFVPTNLQSEVLNISRVHDCIETVFWKSSTTVSSDEFPTFMRFLSESRSHCLENFPDILTPIESLNQYLCGEQFSKSISIKEFMTEKKTHEVEMTARVVGNMVKKYLAGNPEDSVCIVDAGDGKGYLSSRLSLEYGLTVLGIDANKRNSENALERNRKLQRVWNGLTDRAELKLLGISPPRRGERKTRKEQTCRNEAQKPHIGNYKTISRFITTGLELDRLINEVFPTSVFDPAKSASVCITGLHTCGNLAPTVIRLFHTQSSCKMLCNIGCCYHLLKESFSGEECFGNKALMDMQSEDGFPMSAFLRKRNTKIGRNARMLAAQSIDRVCAAQELPKVSLHYRALFELLISSSNLPLKEMPQVGKLRKFKNFSEYVQLCNSKFDFSMKLLEPLSFEEFEKKYAEQRHYLDLFYLLRMSFAPVMETLILLDRLLYLKELGYCQSYLVSLFDAVISPRHYAIVALKT